MIDDTLTKVETDLVNDVCMRIGAALYFGGEVANDSDHGIILQYLRSVASSGMSRGWWFNTRYDVLIGAATLGPITGNFIRVDTSRFQLAGYSPRVQVVPNATTQDATLQDADSGETVFERTFYADVVYRTPWSDLPQEFLDWVSAKTAVRVAPSITTQPIDNNDELQAWNALYRVHAANDRVFNVVDDNPINHNATR